MSYEPIDFTNVATVIEIPVKFPNKTYVLREASGDTAAAYRNASLRCAKFGSDGKVAGMDGMGDLEPLLVHYCLFEPDSTIRVPLETIRAWPSRIVKELHQKAKQISGLEEDTLASLRKQRAEIDEKLAKLEAEDPSKN